MTKISIITVVYNDVTHIKATIDSVLAQKGVDIEYLIIDGGSSDGTLETIISYDKQISFVLSEKDRGIYDAMNKGIINATGEWLIFLNSGDVLIGEYAVQKVIDHLADDVDLVYGNVKVTSDELQLIYDIEAREIEKISNKMIMNHQACLIRRTFHLEQLYDLKYKVTADYKFVLDAYLRGRKIKKIPYTFSMISTGGLSDFNKMGTFKEALRVKNELNPSFFNNIYFIKQVTYAKLIEFSKLIVPKKIFVKLHSLKYSLAKSLSFVK